jgi:hypothetical protein
MAGCRTSAIKSGLQTICEFTNEEPEEESKHFNVPERYGLTLRFRHDLRIEN